jgi:hypothetical protein
LLSIILVGNNIVTLFHRHKCMVLVVTGMFFIKIVGYFINQSAIKIVEILTNFVTFYFFKMLEHVYCNRIYFLYARLHHFIVILVDINLPVK